MGLFGNIDHRYGEALNGISGKIARVADVPLSLMGLETYALADARKRQQQMLEAQQRQMQATRSPAAMIQPDESRPVDADTRVDHREAADTQALIDMLSKLPTTGPQSGLSMDDATREAALDQRFGQQMQEVADKRYLDFMVSDPPKTGGLFGGAAKNTGPPMREAKDMTSYEKAGLKRFGAGYANQVADAKAEQAERRFRMSAKKNAHLGRPGLAVSLSRWGDAKRDNTQDAAMRQAWMLDPAVLESLTQSQGGNGPLMQLRNALAMFSNPFGAGGAAAVAKKTPGAPMVPETGYIQSKEDKEAFKRSQAKQMAQNTRGAPMQKPISPDWAKSLQRDRTAAKHGRPMEMPWSEQWARMQRDEALKNSGAPLPQPDPPNWDLSQPSAGGFYAENNPIQKLIELLGNNLLDSPKII